MNKLTRIATVGLATLALTACGNTDKKEEVKNTVERISTQEEKAVASNSDVYFKDGVLNMEDVTVKILNYEVLKAGSEGAVKAGYKDKSLIVFNYEVTNKSDKDMDAFAGWLASFSVIQDNDPNVVNTLDLAIMLRNEDATNSYEKIKKGGTVKSSAAFVLTDDTTPVTIIGHKGMGGEKIGEQVFDIK